MAVYEQKQNLTCLYLLLTALLVICLVSVGLLAFAYFQNGVDLSFGQNTDYASTSSSDASKEKMLTYNNADYPDVSFQYPRSWNLRETITKKDLGVKEKAKDYKVELSKNGVKLSFYLSTYSVIGFGPPECKINDSALVDIGDGAYRVETAFLSPQGQGSKQEYRYYLNPGDIILPGDAKFEESVNTTAPNLGKAEVEVCLQTSLLYNTTTTFQHKYTNSSSAQDAVSFVSAYLDLSQNISNPQTVQEADEIAKTLQY